MKFYRFDKPGVSEERCRYTSHILKSLMFTNCATPDGHETDT